jgi:hypothetical protein
MALPEKIQPISPKDSIPRHRTCLRQFSDMTTGQMFWIIKNGIKMSGVEWRLTAKFIMTMRSDCQDDA